MTTKVKAVIMRPDHTVQVRVIKEKQRTDRTFKVGNHQYLMDDSHFMITTDRKRGYKRYFSTYYYREGTAMPLPVPDMPNVVDNGLTSDELGAIFNPWFLRVISQMGASKIEKMMMILLVAVACGLLYIGWTVHGTAADIEEIKNLMRGVYGVGTGTTT